MIIKYLNYLHLIIYLSFLYPIFITGKITDNEGSPIMYANIYLKDTFDGTSSDVNGEFIFETYESGLKTLVVSYVGFESYEELHNINEDQFFSISLAEIITQANEVVITAGSFGASDDEKVIVLDPIDIVTVASSRGEISGALEALPGTQPQADKQGIYVRGGDASEAKQVVDGMLIQNPYFSDVPDIPQRGRFEPFDFKGTAFSQGGYSAQYGQALSAIVDLQTWSRFGDFNANTFGITPLSLSYGRAYGNDSTVFGLTIDYTNIEYFQDFNNDGILSDFINNRTNFSNPPEGIEVKTNYSKKFNKGIYKYLGRYTDYSLGTVDSDIGTSFNLNNNNLFLLTTYKGELTDDLLIQLGLSYSDNTNDSEIIIDNFPVNINSYDDLLQFRTVLTKKISSKTKLKFGFHLFDQSSKFMNYVFDGLELGVPSEDYSREVIVNEFLSTGFTEFDLKFSKKIAINAGLRYENSQLLNQSSFSPRFSSAYKIGKNSQISYAYGKFFQTPDMGLDQWYRQNNIITDYSDSGLNFERSIHHILNYEWSKKGKMIRLELFDKQYDNLILLESENCIGEYCINDLNNEGYGYSKGAELFWRYDQTLDGIGQDIWIAYSYLDSKRKFKQYNDEIIPSFASNHKLTFIYKNGFKLSNDAGFNTSLAITATSGYPYYDNWNNIQYESKPYLSFDIGGSYLPNIDNGFMVIFFNISNPFGYRNSYGYNYIDYDMSQLDPPNEKLPSSLRSIFIGCFMFFSIDKNK
tara:strand:+ start:5301 stop:7553 length:2253 start_codon:yes stop_codon:yes gene_type:complete